MRILNLTQHSATPDQIQAGVFEPGSKDKFLALLNFEALPTTNEVWERAKQIAMCAVAEKPDAAMIGGPPYLMLPLEVALRAWDITPLYAFSQRQSQEVMQPDGSVTKTTVFKHAGFVKVA